MKSIIYIGKDVHKKTYSLCALSDSNVIMSQCIQVDNVPIGTLSTCRVKL
ncbi:hypothetical protein [Catenibacterium mitsuokai]